MSIGRCQDCQYWVSIRDNPEMGECRRYPPVVMAHTVIGSVQSLITKWPSTQATAGCGEYQMKA